MVDILQMVDNFLMDGIFQSIPMYVRQFLKFHGNFSKGCNGSYLIEILHRAGQL